MIQVDEVQFSGGKIFAAYDIQSPYPANGGLRVMRYHSEEEAKQEAIGLATKMIHKHHNYNTGFSGGKIVAKVDNFDPNTMSALIDRVGAYLNNKGGTFLTGCDLNFGDQEVHELHQQTKHVLAALNSDVHYAEATASGVIGAVNASLESLMIKNPKVLVHGCGAVGARCAKRLASNMDVLTYDLYPEKADISGCVNISNHTNWIDADFDILIMVSASRILSLNQVKRFNGEAIVCGANIPFVDEAAEQYAATNFLLIDEGIASAGAVIADSIEYYAPDKWVNISPETIYFFIENQVFNRSLGRKNRMLTIKEHFIGQLV